MSAEYDLEVCGCEECASCLGRQVTSLEKALQVMSDGRAEDNRNDDLRIAAANERARVAEAERDVAKAMLANRHLVRLVGPGFEPVDAMLTDGEERWIGLLFDLKEVAEKASAAKIERLDCMAREADEARATVSRLRVEVAHYVSRVGESLSGSEPLLYGVPSPMNCVGAAWAARKHPDEGYACALYGHPVALSVTPPLECADPACIFAGPHAVHAPADVPTKPGATPGATPTDDAAAKVEAAYFKGAEDYLKAHFLEGGCKHAIGDAAKTREDLVAARALLKRGRRVAFRYYDAPPWEDGERDLTADATAFIADADAFLRPSTAAPRRVPTSLYEMAQQGMRLEPPAVPTKPHPPHQDETPCTHCGLRRMDHFGAVDRNVCPVGEVGHNFTAAGEPTKPKAP